MDLSSSEEIVWDRPNVHIAGEKLYFCKETSDESDDDIIQIHEYDFEGHFLYEYVVKNKDMIFKFEYFLDSTYVIIYEESKSTFPRLHELFMEYNNVQVVKLDRGNVFVKELKDIFQLGQSISTRKRYHRTYRFESLSRFGNLYLPLIFVENQRVPDSFGFTTINLATGERMAEIKDVGIWLPTYSVNWNIQEIDMTYFKKKNVHLGKREFYFKISRVQADEFQTLKHLARIAVLTSFTENYLKKQNLPESLFRYLGIEKH